MQSSSQISKCLLFIVLNFIATDVHYATHGHRFIQVYCTTPFTSLADNFPTANRHPARLARLKDAAIRLEAG